jgi:hypothetical protein
LKNQNFRAWANNRKTSKVAKYQTWRHRPLGAFVRAVEIAFIGAPLQQIVRSSNDIDEIKHLLPNLQEIGSEGDFVLSASRVSTKNGLILLESVHIIAPHLNSHNYLSGNLHDEFKVLIRKNPEITPHGFIFMLPKQDYFYHFLIDFLPQILRLNLIVRDLVVLVNSNESAYVFSYLELHALKYERTSAKSVSANSIVAVNYSSQNTREVRSLLFNAKLNVGALPETPAKIAFFRFRGSRHDYIFESKLQKHLKNNGFEIYDPDTLSVPAQIKLFSEATEVIAIHGGVLANLIYCREGTAVHEIFTHPYRTMFFEALSRDLGLIYSSSEAATYDFESLA